MSDPAAGRRYAALVPLLGILWGFNWPAVRIALYEIPPWSLRTLGMLCAGLALLAIAALRGRSLRVPVAHWPRLIVAGLLSIGAFNVLLAFAQLAAATSRAAIVTFTMPVWAALLAWLVLGEKLDRPRVLGFALGLAGLAALGLPLLQAGALSIGLLYALLAGMSWAAGTVFTKRWPTDAGPITFAGWQLLVGAAAGAVGMLVFEGLPKPHGLAPSTWLALAYHILLAQALAYALWFEILPRVPAAISTLGTLMVPAVGVLGAMIFLGERPTPTDLAGLVLVVAAAATILLPAKATPPLAIARR